MFSYEAYSNQVPFGQSPKLLERNLNQAEIAGRGRGIFRQGSIEDTFKIKRPQEVRIKAPEAGKIKMEAPKGRISLETAPSAIAKETKVGKPIESTGVLKGLGIGHPGPKIPPEASSLSPTISNDESLIKQLTKALKEAKPIRGMQEAIYTKARGQKLAKVLSAREDTHLRCVQARHLGKDNGRGKYTLEVSPLDTSVKNE